MKIITKKRQAEIDEMIYQKILLAARRTYEHYCSDADGVVKDENEWLAKLTHAIFQAEDLSKVDVY